MKGRWVEVAKLTFKGERFRDHALDLTAVNELAQFQKLVGETAKVLWRTSHSDRKNLPPHFDSRTRLYLRRIEEGSAVAPLEVFVEDTDLEEYFEPEPVEVKEAINLGLRVFQALEADEPLPETFPRSLIPHYQDFGQGLIGDEAVELSAVAEVGQNARVTPETRFKLLSFREIGHTDEADVSGEVLEADLRQGRFQVWVDEKHPVSVSFSAEQEDTVTTALKEHRAVRLHVRGRGEFSPQGELVRVTEVVSLALTEPGAAGFDSSSPPIEDVLATIAQEIPPEKWEKLPKDLSENLDEYLYGPIEQ